MIKTLKSGWRRCRLPAAVVVTATLPVVLYAEKNKGALFYRDAVELFLLAAAFGLIIWGISRLILRDWLRAALFTVFFTTLFLRFTQLSDLAQPVTDIFGQPRHVARFLFVVAIPVMLWAAAKLRRRWLSVGIDYILAAGLFLSLFTLGQIGVYLANNSGVMVTAADRDIRQAKPKPAKQQPDIYYLVFEDYTGPVGLREAFHSDPAPLQRAIESRGMYYATRSFSNYPTTIPSLASSLNGGLLQVKGPAAEVNTANPLFHLYDQPAVAEFLKHQGYQFTQISSWWAATGQSDYADHNPRYGWELPILGHDFNTGYYKGIFLIGTFFGDIYDSAKSSRFSPVRSHGDIFLAQMDGIAAEAKQNGKPKFVFSQLMLPHNPYVFDANGHDGNPHWTKQEAYLQQLAFTNKQLLKLVDRLKAAYPKDKQPVIVISSDEGAYPGAATGESALPDAEDELVDLRLKSSIPGYFYFPDRDYRSLYPEITPVNILRVVFNKYFAAGLELEPDKIFGYAALDHKLDFVDVTRRVRGDDGQPPK